MPNFWACPISRHPKIFEISWIKFFGQCLFIGFRRIGERRREHFTPRKASKNSKFFGTVFPGIPEIRGYAASHLVGLAEGWTLGRSPDRTQKVVSDRIAAKNPKTIVSLDQFRNTSNGLIGAGGNPSRMSRTQRVFAFTLSATFFKINRIHF